MDESDLLELDQHAAIRRRLHRAEGQVRGLAHMVDEGRPCIEILTQIAAARGALEAIAVAVLQQHVREALTHATPEEAAASIVDGIASLPHG